MIWELWTLALVHKTVICALLLIHKLPTFNTNVSAIYGFLCISSMQDWVFIVESPAVLMLGFWGNDSGKYTKTTLFLWDHHLQHKMLQIPFRGQDLSHSSGPCAPCWCVGQMECVKGSQICDTLLTPQRTGATIHNPSMCFSNSYLEQIISILNLFYISVLCSFRKKDFILSFIREPRQKF